MNSKSDKQESWKQACIALLHDPTARIDCPNCEQATLSVIDLFVAGSPTYERKISCPECGRFDMARMTYRK